MRIGIRVFMSGCSRSCVTYITFGRDAGHLLRSSDGIKLAEGLCFWEKPSDGAHASYSCVALCADPQQRGTRYLQLPLNRRNPMANKLPRTSALCVHFRHRVT